MLHLLLGFYCKLAITRKYLSHFWSGECLFTIFLPYQTAFLVLPYHSLFYQQRNPASAEDAVMTLFSPEHKSAGSSKSNQDALFY